MPNALTRWFHCLAEVPGLDYVSDLTVDRAKLRGSGAAARVRVWDLNGRRTESLEWVNDARSAKGEGTWGTSASPCSAWETKSKRGESPARTVLRQVREALELPGTARDYHFVLQQGVMELWRHRDTEPWVLGELESLCLLDIRLITTYPDAVRNEYLDEQLARRGVEQETGQVAPREFFSVVTIDYLLRLYEREGYLHEALDIARRAVLVGGSREAVSQLEERLKAVADERIAAG